MKVIKPIRPLSILLLLILTALLSSCSKDTDSLTSAQNDYSLTAKIDGVVFSTENVLVSASANETEFYLISAIGDNGSFGLTLPSPVTEGTFTSMEETVALFYQTTSPFVVWAANEDEGSGTITISENNSTYVEGTFSFAGFNPIDNSILEVTEGKFKAQKL